VRGSDDDGKGFARDSVSDKTLQLFLPVCGVCVEFGVSIEKVTEQVDTTKRTGWDRNSSAPPGRVLPCIAFSPDEPAACLALSAVIGRGGRRRPLQLSGRRGTAVSSLGSRTKMATYHVALAFGIWAGTSPHSHQ
jgi:hypothetical protein